MSFATLMEDATNIQSTAIRKAVQRHEADPAYAARGVEAYYDDIPGLYRPFADMPNPAAYDPMIDDLRRALQGLSAGQQNQDPINARENYFANPTLAKMTTASDYLEDWTGRAAMAFKQNFLDPFPPLARNQFILTSVLKAGLEAHKSMWEKARDDIDNIAHLTLDALEHQERCDPNKWTVTFTVVASVAAVAAVPLADVGLAAALTVTAIGAASQVVAAAPPQPPTAKYQGETVRQIIDHMKEAIRRLADEIHGVETKIYQALDATNNLALANQRLFLANRPALADATAGNVTSSGYLGTSG